MTEEVREKRGRKPLPFALKRRKRTIYVTEAEWFLLREALIKLRQENGRKTNE